MNQHAADLYWLAFLLTGEPGPSLDITLESLDGDHGDATFFNNWMSSWSRRVVISKALNTIREPLAQSVQRTESARHGRMNGGPRGAAIPQGFSKAQLESALLAIDIFPRCVLVLTIFERMAVEDVAVLLDAEPKLIRKAQLLALLALNSRVQPAEERAAAASYVIGLEAQHA